MTNLCFRVNVVYLKSVSRATFGTFLIFEPLGPAPRNPLSLVLLHVFFAISIAHGGSILNEHMQCTIKMAEGWDSNPRTPSLGISRFQDEHDRALCHPSVNFGGEGEISTRKRLSATSRFERGGLGNVQLLHGGVDMGRTCMA